MMQNDSIGMNRYITQLIEDFNALQRAPREPWYQPEKGVELDYDDVERLLCSGQEYQIGNLLDLQPEQFPPAHRLTIPQMLALVSAYSELLESWGVCLVIPEKLPTHRAYTLLASTLERNVFISQFGMVTLEFCNYNCEECPFGSWCHCEAYTQVPANETEGNVRPSESPKP